MNYKRIGYNKLSECLVKCDWSVLFNANDIDVAVGVFNKLVGDAIAACCPKSATRKGTPWMNSKLSKLMKVHEKAYGAFRNTKSNDAKLIYRIAHSKYCCV